MTRHTVNPVYARKGDLTKGPVSGHLVRLTVPMVWGIFAIISFQLVDTFYVSMLGTTKLAAMTFTFPVTYAVFTLFLGLSIATSSVIARQIGEGNEDKVKRIVTHALILAGISGIVLAVAGCALMNPIFMAMGADRETLPLIRSYMGVWFAGWFLTAIPMVGNAALRAGGDSLVPAVIMTVAAVVNIVLDPVLIFGLFGFPRLELQGAAIATVFANFCAMLAGLYVLHVRRKMICRDGLHLKHFKDSLKRLAYIALPVGLTGAIMPISNAVIIALLATYGADAVAAFGVVSRIEAFAFTVIMALATGMAPIIGQNWGAGQTDRVRETLKLSFTFAALWSLLSGLVFIVFAERLATLFSAGHAPDFVRITVLYFYIVALTYVPGNMVAGWSSAFNAMGMPRRSFMMNVIKMIALQIPLAVLGSRLFGVPGIFASIAVTNVLTGAAFHLANARLFSRYEREAVLQGAGAS